MPIPRRFHPWARACCVLTVTLVLAASGWRAVRAREGQPAAAYDARIAALVNQVSSERLTARIQELENYQTRYYTTGQARLAATAIADAFRQLGLAVEIEAFTVGGVASSNVVATIPGRTTPAQIVIVGAHYDSYAPRVFLTTAPGADDNASGTAGVLEIARILAGQPFDCTIRLIAFGAEEHGFDGSFAHANAAKARGDAIVAMLNMDMIGYVDRAPEDLDVVADTASAWIGDRFVEAAGLYTALPILKRVDPTSVYSDHYPFWLAGYPAVEIIEDDDVPNPYYHTVNDRLTTLNPAFATAAVGTTLAVAATLARPTSSNVPVFTDDPLVAGATAVKAVHIAELRAEIDTRRVRYGLPSYAWTDATLVAGATTAKAVHLTELRAALDAVYVAAGRTPPAYTPAGVTAGTTLITAAQIAEVRAAVAAIW